MFVQSARFVAEHQKNPSSELAIHGQEKVAATLDEATWTACPGDPQAEHAMVPTTFDTTRASP